MNPFIGVCTYGGESEVTRFSITVVFNQPPPSFTFSPVNELFLISLVRPKVKCLEMSTTTPQSPPHDLLPSETRFDESSVPFVFFDNNNK